MLDCGNTSRDVWADKGYIDKEREERLRAKGWRLHIQRKGQSGRALSQCQEQRNRRIAKTRARVEHVFASLEQMGGKALRSIGLARATLHLNWKAATYNLRRLCSLVEAGPTPFLKPQMALQRTKRPDQGPSRGRKPPHQASMTRQIGRGAASSRQGQLRKPVNRDAPVSP